MAVGVLLMLVAVLGGTSLIKSAQARTPVLVAARALEPGQVIGPDRSMFWLNAVIYFRTV